MNHGPRLGLGLEHLGTFSARRPWQALAIVAVISIIAAFGLPKLHPDDNLSGLFRSTTTAYADYQALSALFPTSEHDVLAVVEGDHLFEKPALEALRAAQVDLELEDSVSQVVSMFSMREAPAGPSATPPPVFPDVLPDGDALTGLLRKAEAHPLIAGRLMARQGTGGLALLVIGLDKDALAAAGPIATLAAIRATAAKALSGTGLSLALTGTPAMQIEIREAIKRDRIVYNVVGFVVGSLISFAFFRRAQLVAIGATAPAVAVLWAMGLLGHAGQPLNSLINVIPPLVMVIAFCDSMHVVQAIRAGIAAGLDRYEAAERAVAEIGPACVLTSAATSLDLLTMVFTDSDTIYSFGIAAAASTALTFLATLLLVPALCVLLLRDEKAFRRKDVSHRRAIDRLERASAGIAAAVGKAPARIVLASILAVAALAWLDLHNQAHYRLSDQVPSSLETVGALHRLEARFRGVQPVQVLIRGPVALAIDSQAFGSVIGGVHAALEHEPGIASVWSLEAIRRWLASGEGRTGTSPVTIARALDLIPSGLQRRFVNREARAALVTGTIGDLSASDASQLAARLDASLDAVRAAHAGFAITVTGLPVLAARSSISMIEQLNWNLVGSLGLVIALIGLAFRSLEVCFLTAVPTLFPVVVSGALLDVTGWGLDFPSVIALIIGLGLAVDNTIHFFNHLRHEQAVLPDLRQAVAATLIRAGPIFALTTLVLIAGVSVTLLSTLAPMRLFGILMITTLAAALAGDMVILPALVLWAGRTGAPGQETVRAEIDHAAR